MSSFTYSYHILLCDDELLSLSQTEDDSRETSNDVTSTNTSGTLVPAPPTTRPPGLPGLPPLQIKGLPPPPPPLSISNRSHQSNGSSPPQSQRTPPKAGPLPPLKGVVRNLGNQFEAVREQGQRDDHSDDERDGDEYKDEDDPYESAQNRNGLSGHTSAGMMLGDGDDTEWLQQQK